MVCLSTSIFGRRLRSHQGRLNRVIPTAIDAGPTPSCESGNCTRHLFCGPPSVYRVEITVEKEHAEGVCVYEQAPPRCCSSLAYPIACGRKSTLLPNRRGLWSSVGCGDPS